MKYKGRGKRKILKTWQVSLILLVVVLFLSITYAQMSSILRIFGTVEGDWKEFSITYININNSSLYPSTIKYMQTYTCTFTNQPAIDNIIMGDTTLQQNTDYTYINGVLTIPEVKGNLVIQGQMPVPQDYTITYVYGDNLVFDGQTMLDTGMDYLSNNQFNRDFELTLHIDNYVYDSSQNNGYNTLVKCTNHIRRPYHGFIIRRDATKNYLKGTQSNNTVAETTFDADTIEDIHIKRLNKILYIDFNNSYNFTEFGNMSNLRERSRYNLIIGADINILGLPYRYFTGQLSNVKIKNYYSIEETSVRLPLPKYTFHEFDGWYLDPEFTIKVGDGGTNYQPSGDVILYAKWIPAPDIIFGPKQDEYTFDGEYDFGRNGYINTNVCFSPYECLCIVQSFY